MRTAICRREEKKSSGHESVTWPEVPSVPLVASKLNIMLIDDQSENSSVVAKA